MNTIGIIGAMEEEVAVLKDKLDLISVKNIIGIDFYMGKMAGKNVVLVRSGIGKVNAAICAQVLIDLYGIDCAIHLGVAGAIQKELNIGDVVISSDVVQHDFDTSFTGDPVGIIPRMETSFFPADQTLIQLAEASAKDVLPESNKAVVARVATGDQFIATSEAKQTIWNQFKAYCAEMEGAAVGQTCYLNRIPFVIIRSISDKADEKAMVSFTEFAKTASEISSRLVEHMLQSL